MVFWVSVLYSWCVFQCFGGTYCFHLQFDSHSSGCCIGWKKSVYQLCGQVGGNL